MQNPNVGYPPQQMNSAPGQPPLPSPGPPGTNPQLRPLQPQRPTSTTQMPQQLQQNQSPMQPRYPPAQQMRPPGLMQMSSPAQQPPPQSEMPGQRQSMPQSMRPLQPMRPMPPGMPQQQSTLPAQMQNMSIQSTPPANGHMHPAPPTTSPQQMPQQMRPMYPAHQPARPTYPPPGQMQSQQQPQPPPQQQQSQMPAQPGQYAAQSRVPLRPASMRPNPVAAAAGPYPPEYAGSHASNGYAPPQQSMAPGQQMPPQQPAIPEQHSQSKLSSSMVPRPCSLEKECGAPRSYYHRGMFKETDGTVFPYIPSSNSDFISVDDGSARIRFFRITANTIASDPSLMSKSGVPLAAVMTPFADPVPGEAPVPVVDFSSKQVGGPLRCDRCNGYANPGFKFMSGGSQFQCNLCTHINTTPTEHFSPISPATGLRMDADQRHELRLGSVDYLVGSPDYCIRPPKPACYLFAIDVSTGSISSGLSSSALMSIKSAIGAGLLPGSGQGARVAIMTFDKALHFFDARGAEGGKPVTMQFVPDILDPFVPMGGESLFLTPAEAVLAVDSAIEVHGLSPNSQQQNRAMNSHDTASAESALGSALQAIKQAFADCGGKAFVIAGSLPNAGMAKLERRGGGAVGGGEDREMGLLKGASSNYDILGCELAEVQASVDLFLAPSSVYIDAATLSRVPRNCGGRMHLFPGFDPVRDGASLHRSLCASAGQPRAFEALMRVRTSPGLESRGEFLGSFGRPQRGDDVSGPVFDASSTLALELTVASKLIDEQQKDNRPYPGGASLFDDACVQCAILYTDSAGRRCIRVHTGFASKSKESNALAEVFRHADVDATACFLAKKASSAVLVGGTAFSKACEALTEKVAQTFYSYRKYCTTSSLSGQLILPEALKILPVMMLGLIKSAAFRKSALSMQSGDAVTVDERAAALSFLTSGRVDEIAAMCYPRMWDISKMNSAAGIPSPPAADPVVSGTIDADTSKILKSNEPIAMPNTLLLSAECLTDKRILLIENGMQIVVWLGTQVERSSGDDVIVHGAGGRMCIRGETAGSVALTKDISEHGQRVAKVIQRITSQRRGLTRPQAVVRSSPGAGGEAKFVIPLLVEDRGTGPYSYVEYLKHIHKRVMDKMANDSAQSDMQTWEMLNHGY